jgi:flavin reductase (DIM6/NTAB) family NADH-FMN oxidoreductase RutF
MTRKKAYSKRDFPVWKARRFLEPGPVVLVSSAWKGKANIMTLGWHTVMEFEPSRLGCFITDANHSYEMIRKSRECVINVPEAHLAREVVGIGNCSGRDVDKFEKFGLTPAKSSRVGAPRIAECHANLECRVADTSLLRKYGFFILEVVKAVAAVKPKYPATMHYRGDGIFMLSGRNVSWRSRFRPENL